MTRSLYFADKVVVFTTEKPSDPAAVWLDAVREEISQTKILKILETNNFLAVISPDPNAAFEALAAEFMRVEAAGGIVVNDCGEWLLMRRKGRWDLPKGHIEPGEQADVCAVREIAEETGVVGAKVVRPLCETDHAYFMHGRWELKRTHWFELHIASCDTLAPQCEEGIECVAWVAPDEVEERLGGAFPTVRCVAECMRIANGNSKFM